MINHIMARKNSSSQREEEVFQELNTRWLQPDRKAYGLMDGKQYWFVRCPKCSKGGDRMGTGSQGNRVLKCHSCQKVMPMGELVKHYAPDLSDVLWGSKGTLSGRPAGKRASDADERKRWAQEQRRRFLSATADSADPFGNSECL